LQQAGGDPRRAAMMFGGGQGLPPNIDPRAVAADPQGFGQQGDSPLDWLMGLIRQNAQDRPVRFRRVRRVRRRRVPAGQVGAPAVGRDGGLLGFLSALRSPRRASDQVGVDPRQTGR
jgi:hypothetical protein